MNNNKQLFGFSMLYIINIIINENSKNQLIGRPGWKTGDRAVTALKSTKGLWDVMLDFKVHLEPIL